MPWLADLEQLRDAMSAGYANLEWQAQRGYDLPVAYARARGRLEAARDSYEARRAVERFLAGFGDGHLEVHWPSTSKAPASAPQPLCARLGYFEVPDDGGPAMHLPGQRTIGPLDAHLKAGILTVANRKLAILRIAMFSPHGYPDICERVARDRGLTAQSPCDETCHHSFEQAADRAFIDEMARQLAAITALKPDALLIDIAANGGGNDSSLALARMVTARPLARAQGGGLRGPDWGRELADREADVPKALAVATPADRREDL